MNSVFIGSIFDMSEYSALIRRKIRLISNILMNYARGYGRILCIISISSKRGSISKRGSGGKRGSIGIKGITPHSPTALTSGSRGQTPKAHGFSPGTLITKPGLMGSLRRLSNQGFQLGSHFLYLLRILIGNIELFAGIIA